MTEQQYMRERMRQARLERLGTNNPQCIICGDADPAHLELHHVAGRVFGDQQVIVCRNHHRNLSDLQKEQPSKRAGSPSQLECDGRLLLGIADILQVLQSPIPLIDMLRGSGSAMIENSITSIQRE